MVRQQPSEEIVLVLRQVHEGRGCEGRRACVRAKCTTCTRSRTITRGVRQQEVRKRIGERLSRVGRILEE